MVPDSGKFTTGGTRGRDSPQGAREGEIHHRGHERERFTTGGTRGRDSPQSTRRARRGRQRGREKKEERKRNFDSFLSSLFSSFLSSLLFSLLSAFLSVSSVCSVVNLSLLSQAARGRPPPVIPRL
jgi:hypothetical protein